MIDIERIRNLIKSVPRPPEVLLRDGCSDAEIDAFSQDADIDVPDDLRAWLKTCNGACIGPGGVFGIEVTQEYLNIQSLLSAYPSWLDKKWIPVAGDGCGNYFVVCTQLEHGAGYPVLFVDTHEASDEPAYIVASDLSHFLIFLLEEELRPSGWPFSKESVVEKDPSIVDFHGVSLPWDS